MSVADRKVTALTDGSHWDNFPQWSPKGDVIMFTSDRDGDFEIYTIRPNGTSLRRITRAPGLNAHSAWSPDGERVVFSSGRKGFKDEMWRSTKVFPSLTEKSLRCALTAPMFAGLRTTNGRMPAPAGHHH